MFLQMMGNSLGAVSIYYTAFVASATYIDLLELYTQVKSYEKLKGVTILMNHKMFCFQCEQTAGCTGCTGNAGVCGKTAKTA